MNIHIIGGGNLGVAIAAGLTNYSKGNHITITRRNTAQIQYLSQNGITVSSNNIENIDQADVIILTIKPYQIDTVVNEILPHISNKIIASGVSGVSLETLQQKTKGAHPIVRIMPNIAAQFAESATCISFSEQNKEPAEQVIWLFNHLETAIVI